MSIQADVGVIPHFTLSDRLRKAREHAGLGQDEFAVEVGISRGAVINYERGKVEPREVVLKMWALCTGVPLHWLKTGEAPHHDGEGLREVRPEGFEPPTFWLGVSNVTDFTAYRARRAA